MSFKCLFQDMAVLQIGVMGDLATTITYNKVVLGKYDPTSGTDASKTVSYQLKALVSKVTATQEVLNSTSQVDAKVAIAAKTTPFTPQLNDILISNGQMYQVVEIAVDAATAMWNLSVRGL